MVEPDDDEACERDGIGNDVAAGHARTGANSGVRARTRARKSKVSREKVSQLR